MLEIDREESERAIFTFRNILIVFTLIFVMGGAIHLSGSDTQEGLNASADTTPKGVVRNF